MHDSKATATLRRLHAVGPRSAQLPSAWGLHVGRSAGQISGANTYTPPLPGPPLVKVMARAHRRTKLLGTVKYATVKEIAVTE